MLRMRERFTEKQLYIRSKGAVTYVTLTPSAQIGLCFFAFSLCLWVGFASINTLLEDEIVQKRNSVYAEKIASYEEKLNKIQVEYDTLRGQLSVSRDWFTETTKALEERHNELTRMLEENARISSNLQSMQSRYARVKQKNNSREQDFKLVANAERRPTIIMESRLNTLSSSDTDKENKVQFSKADFGESYNLETSPHNIKAMILQSDVRERVNGLKTRQKNLLDALEESTDRKIKSFEALIATTEILEPNEFVAQMLPDAKNAVGGPFIPLLTGSNHDNTIQKQLFRISNNLQKLENLSTALTYIPLSLPIHHQRISSDFGPRLDPFKKRAAFHSGLDFSASIGTPVYASLNGKISFAGRRGPYGLAVEIDHNNGFKTRYAHLNKILVRRGQQVRFQDIIGESGNSGRSTGPHLHYEVWYNGKVRNPQPFINAGKHIFNTSELVQYERRK